MEQKILYIASTDGHLRSFHLPYLEALVRSGHAVTAAGAGDGHGLPAGVDFVAVPFTKSFVSPKNFRAALRIARLQRSEKFDLILTHTSLAAFFTRLGIMLAGKKNARVVNTVHGYLFDDRSPLLRRTVLLWAERLTRGVTDEILTMNAEDTSIARRHRLCRGAVTEIPGMGLPAEARSPVTPEQRTEARAALGLPEDAFVLLCAAEFTRRKNQAMLIRAMAALPEDVLLLLPGAGELWEDCRALARSLGLESRVIFPGFVSDLTACRRAADVCVSASRSEGLPFHVMEAMAAGLPAVLSDVKGHRDLMRGGDHGLLYPFGDADAFVAAAETLYRDPALRAAFGKKAVEAVRPYTLDAVLPRVLALYLGEKNIAPFGTNEHQRS